MTLFKQITLVLIVLVAVIASVGALIVSQLDLNHHKDRIQQLVLDKTGRELLINGEVSARVFPWLGLSLQDVSLGNAQGFSDSKFASAQLSDLQVEALPLLFGRVNVKTVQLHGLSLKLQRDADGKTNWDDLMSATTVVETETGGDVVQEVEAGAPVVAALSIGGLHITDASITLTDARDSSTLSLSNLNLSTGTIVLSEPFAFDADFLMLRNTGEGWSSEVTATGEVALNLADNVFRLLNLKLSTISAGANLPLENLPVTVGADLMVDLKAQTLDIVVADGTVLGVPVSGEFHATDVQGKPRIVGRLSSGDFDAVSIFDQLGLDEEKFPRRDLLSRASVAARFDQADGTLLIEEVQASLGEIKMAGNFRITNLSTAPVLSGQLRIDSFDPTVIFDSASSSVDDPHSLQFETTVRQSGELLSFNQLKIQLDDSLMTGDIEFADIKADNPPITYALTVDEIDLDRYIRQERQSNTEKDATVQGTTTQHLPLDSLRQLNVAGEFVVEQLTMAGLTARNVVLPIAAQEGRLELKEAKAELYSGSFFSTVSLDVQSDEPLLTIAGNLNGLDAQPLLADALNKEAPISGIANINIDVLSRGLSSAQILERANGAVSMRLTDGTINGVDVASKLRLASALVSDEASGKSSDDTASTDVTDFSELSVSAEIIDGAMQSDDLVFTSDLLQLSGEGGVNLATLMLDYLLHITVTDGETPDDVLRKLSGMELSVPVRGRLKDLSLDFKTLFIDVFESNLMQQLRERQSDWLDQKKAQTADRIEAEKTALRERLAAEREKSAELIVEKRQQLEQTASDRKQSLQKKLEREKDALKDNLTKDLNDLLGEN